VYPRIYFNQVPVGQHAMTVPGKIMHRINVLPAIQGASHAPQVRHLIVFLASLVLIWKEMNVWIIVQMGNLGKLVLKLAKYVIRFAPHAPKALSMTVYLVKLDII
jgi:hypothetical protein